MDPLLVPRSAPRPARPQLPLQEVGLSERFTLVYRSLQNCVLIVEGERDGLAEGNGQPMQSESLIIQYSELKTTIIFKDVYNNEARINACLQGPFHHSIQNTFAKPHMP